MRILFDARAVQGRSDGLSNYVRHLLTALLRYDSKDEYVVILGPALRDYLASRSLLDRPNTHFVLSSIPFMGVEQQLRIPLLTLRLTRAALYHYPHFDLPLLAHPRSLVTIHDLNQIAFTNYFGSHLKWFYSLWTTRLTVAKARHIITVSNTTKSELLKRFRWLNPLKISTIYHGLNDAFRSSPDLEKLERFRRKFHLGNDRFILYVGTNRANKNLERLLEAYRRLRCRSTLTHKLLLVGSPKEEGGLRCMITARGLDGFVLPLGYVEEEELPLAYRAADAFVFCSLSEGFGMPLLEAMASGVPILTSNLGATAEVAGDSAFRVDPFSVDAIAKGLSELLSSDGLRQMLVTRGLERVKNFTWEEAARQTLQVYTEVSEGGKP